MRILVIGGTGFIGPAVVTRLLERGHELALFHRGQRMAAHPQGVQQILGERRNLAAFVGSFQHFAPEVVLDMWPQFEHDARAVVGLFTGLARRTVAISSQDVFRAYGRVRGIEPGDPDPRAARGGCAAARATLSLSRPVAQKPGRPRRLDG